MLTQEENEFLCRVGPQTPMGELLRRFWMPSLLSEELPEPDCRPVRVRILGEDLIAFRDSDGRPGLLANNCPHRGASLFFGRNEESGLRCVYHGWKFDVAGHCVDMPNEPPESNFKDKVHAVAYPCREAGGVVWAYMGPPEHQPELLPQFEWTLVPPEQRIVSKLLQESNWIQGLEGGIDSSHVSFLHSNLDAFLNRDVTLMSKDKAPEFRVANTDFGCLIGAKRKWEDNRDYWRVTPYSLPFYTVIPGYPDRDSIYSGHGWVPIDDEHCWLLSYSWHPSRPLGEFGARPGHPAHYVEMHPGTRRPIASLQNDFLLDPEAQRTKTFSGIENGSTQDRATQESMGPIYDRTLEHLGSSDSAVIMMRRRLMQMARELEQGTEPFAALHGEIFRLRSAGLLLEPGTPYVEASTPYVRVGV
ncbi:MAG TPA: Rieske 2Fe-2S domain-containing protein [Dehalococcoidia bacterium]|nr:Rieske 2Fe-2S domain-containing protein [Dehalococcoidia bacterium]